ncbi:NAD-dependent epimerase/dehydratase family protein [Treponema ruminis]|uniref:Nucleoside-diphosphate-sugar epimerase n=1 Tax=Treponema ruminis TaxID=744515 RepID=A0A7W8G7E8_9SPIR|nr:NAD-dependent epimerase/dehydratase family protein [Treponema ruminis]MBB5225263.1 nucleoside-diphosphate-sugar epimerase [Treponema ruminis]QSI01866.1 NAD-dependent epimerase/dehydratase family protein [Treponema ruminis]
MKNIDLENKTLLVTGAAGFIGSFLTKRILESVKNCRVIGVDCITDYYDISLKEERLSMLSSFGERFAFIKADIADRSAMEKIFSENKISVVVNLAAQAGVRYSIDNPDAYIHSNMLGFYTILELCRHYPVEHLVYASSSSVYGTNKKVPYSTEDKVDNPVSLYAATKKSNELFAHAYAKLYKIPCTGLRFFTVYGPMGRPDMAYFKFTNKLVKGEAIQIYNMGDMYRDFTYIDDIVTGILNVMQKTPAETEDGAPYKVYNIGNNNPESLMYFVETLEKCLLKEEIITEPAKKELLPMQPGDVYQTYADVADLQRDFGFKPATPLSDGLAKFAAWYKGYYNKH